MNDLTIKQRAHLRSLAHKLKPALHVGKDGVTGATADALRVLFAANELLKIKVLATAPADARESADDLARRAEAHLVQVIGRTAVLYRPHPERPQIRLPPAARET